MPYIPFTDEQKRQANLMDLSEFLRRKGEPLIQSGRELRMGSNHSVTVRGNEWYDHAAETGGGPVSFLKEFYGMDYPEAVLALLGQDGGPLRQIRAPNEKMKKSVVHSAPSTSSAVALIFSTASSSNWVLLGLIWTIFVPCLR